MKEMSLSPQQEKVVRMLMLGHSNKGIARQLGGMSEKTVAEHIRRAGIVAGVHGRVSLALWAYERFVVRPRLDWPFMAAA